MNIIFLGTPEFAVPALKVIANDCLNLGNSNLSSNKIEKKIVAVISQPDREKDKKGNLLTTPVKAAALELGLKVYQFDSVNKNIEFIKSLRPDLMITAAFGQILSDEFLKIAPVFNLHASLLPLYRGSSPIQASIISGDLFTGITIMRTVKAMDAGDIVLTDKVSIKNSDTYKTLHDKLSDLGANLIIKAINDFSLNKIKYTPQDNTKVTYVKKVTKQDGLIDFGENADLIERKVRAYNPWPSAYAIDNNGNTIKILATKAIKTQSMSHIICENDIQKAKIGAVLLACKKQGLYVKCKNDILKIEALQLSGKKPVSFSEFLNGYKLESF